MSKKTVLFICTHNSARSQMAEGLTNHFLNDSWEAFSAGIEETVVKPEAVKVMKDIGIDIHHHRSKTVQEFSDRKFDLVVTVCDSAAQSCPFFPGKKVIRQSFDDPSQAPPIERLEAFRKTRDTIKKWIMANLKNQEE